MTRDEAIAMINASLPVLGDSQVDAIAEMVQSMAESTAPLHLTAEDLAGIERSKEDFKHGRTLSSEEYEAEMDAFMERLSAKHAVTS